MGTTTTLRAVLLSVVMSLGCASKEPAPTPGAATVAEAPGTPSAATAKADAEAAAIGRVIEVYNDLIGETRRSVLDPYMSRIGPSLPPPDKLAQIRLGNLVGPWDKLIADATKDLGAARKAAPELALIADAEAMLGRVQDLGEAYRAAGRYFAAETFKDDGGAGAAPLHEAVVAAVGAFQGARRKVGDALEAREQDELRRELARHAATTMSHQFRKALLAAKVLLAARNAEDLPAAFATANEAFQAADLELDAFATARPDAPLAFKNFHRQIHQTLAPHAAKLARELGDPKAHPAQVEADIGLVGSYYNNLVQATNALLEHEGQGQLN